MRPPIARRRSRARFAAADSRVRYHRNETNIGGARNQKLTVDLSTGRYVRLAAHDDLVAPTLLEECVAELERRPDIVICYPGTVVIDPDGKEVSEYQVDPGYGGHAVQAVRRARLP